MKKTTMVITALILSLSSIFSLYGNAYDTTGPTESTLIRAHAFAYENQITSVQSIDWFRPQLLITREQSAKMMVNFARTALGDGYFDRPDLSIYCNFSDKNSISKDLRAYVMESCRFGIFKGVNNTINPKGNLTQAQAYILIGRIVGKSIGSSAGTGYITRGAMIQLMYDAYQNFTTVKQ